MRVLAGLMLVGGTALMPAVAQRPNLSGRWTFNATQSHTPRDRMQAGDSAGGEQRGGRFPGIGGRRGGFRGERGGFRGGAGGGMSDAQRQRLRQTMQLAFQAPAVFTIADSDSSVTFTPDSGAALVLYTDGRKLKQPVDSGGDVEIKAHWQGNDLVVERQVSGGGKVTEDYLRSQDDRQLFVIVSLDAGRRSLVFRRVYDAAPPR